MGHTDVDKCGSSIRWSLVIVNILVLVGGIAVLAVGIWTLVDKSYIEMLLRNNLFMSAAYIMIIGGAISACLSLIGFIGALKETKCLLLTYFILVFLIFVVLLIGGVLGYVFRHQVESTMRPEMLYTISQYNPNNPSDPITKAWDDTQSQLKCCGVRKHRDSTENPWDAWKQNKDVNSGEADKKVPKSCCIVNESTMKVEDCHMENPVDENHIYQKDCFAVGLSFVRGHTTTISSISIGIACIMILGMVLSLMLFKLIE